MAASISNISVRLSMSSKAFSDGVGKAGRSLGAFERQIQRAGKDINKGLVLGKKAFTFDRSAAKTAVQDLGRDLRAALPILDSASAAIQARFAKLKITGAKERIAKGFDGISQAIQAKVAPVLSTVDQFALRIRRRMFVAFAKTSKGASAVGRALGEQLTRALQSGVAFAARRGVRLDKISQAITRGTLGVAASFGINGRLLSGAATLIGRGIARGLGASTGLIKFGFLKLAASVRTLAAPLAVAVAAAAAAVSLGLRKAFENIDTQAKFAARIGVSTKALAGLELRAGLTGVQVNQLRLGLQRMTRRVAEAAQGIGEARGALNTLGLDAKKLAKLTPDQQFQAIADAMERVDSQSERVRLAFKLFDAEGVALVNTMKGGSKAIKETQTEAEKLGLAFSEVDARQVEQANDAIARLKGAFTGVLQELAIKLAPAIATAADALTAMFKKGSTGALLLSTAVELIVRGFLVWKGLVQLVAAGTLVSFGAMGRGLALLAKGFDYVFGTKSSDKIKQFSNDIIAESKRIAQEGGQAIRDGFSFESPLDKFKKNLSQPSTKLDNPLQIDEQETQRLQQVEDRLKGIKDELANIGKTSIQSALDELKDMGATATQIDQARIALEKTNAARASEGIKSQLSDLSKEQARIGLSDIEIKLLDAKDAGATLRELVDFKSRLEQIDARKGFELDTEKAKAGLESLRLELEALSLSPAEKRLKDFSSISTVTPFQIEQFKKLQIEIESTTKAQDALKKSQADAAQIFDQTRTPLEQYESKVGNLDSLLKQSLINWDTYGRAIRAARTELESAADAQKKVALDRIDQAAPKSFRAGGAEAQRLQVQIERAERITQRIEKDQLSELQEQTGLLGNIATEIAKPRNIKEVEIF